MAIVPAAGQHCPGDAGKFVGDRDHHFVPWNSLTQPMHLLSQSRSVVLDAKRHGTGPVDQHATQIDVAAFTYAQRPVLASGGILPWHDSNPGREIASPVKRCPVCQLDGRRMETTPSAAAEL
jgi:hypothetical protein